MDVLSSAFVADCVKANVTITDVSEIFEHAKSVEAIYRLGKRYMLSCAKDDQQMYVFKKNPQTLNMFLHSHPEINEEVRDMEDAPTVAANLWEFGVFFRKQLLYATKDLSFSTLVPQ